MAPRARRRRGETIEHVPALEESLRAMEPALPAPPDELLTPDELGDALDLADAADGTLPRFLDEQRRPRTEAQVAREDHEARMERGKAALAKRGTGVELTQDEFADECYYLDPVSNAQRRKPSR